MRAWDITLFLLIFNVTLFFTNEMGMYGAAHPGGRIIDLPIILGLAGLAAGIVAASITVLGTKIVQPIGVVATAFTFVYFGLFVNAIAILSEIGVPSAMLTALVGINIVVFAMGLIQMVAGGWRTYR